MKRNIFLVFITIFITSCSGSKKIKGITEFTERLLPNSTHSVSLNNPEKLSNFYNQLIFTQNQGMLVHIDPIKPKAFRKLGLSDKLASMPNIIDGNIYTLSTSGRVASYNLDTGKYNWKTPVVFENKNIVAGTLTYNSGKLFITADLELIVLDALSGKEIIRKGLTDITKNYPLVVSNALLMQTASNSLVAYNSENWKQVWAYETWPEYISSNSLTSPVLVSDIVITGFSTGQLVANRVADGSEIWQINLIRETDAQLSYNPLDLSCQPVFQDRFLYVASNNGYLIKLDLLNASIVWKRKVQDIISMSISGTGLFVTNNARQIAAISTFDGSVIWVNDILDEKIKAAAKQKIKPASFMSPVATTEGLLVFASDGMGFRFDNMSGVLIEKFTLPNNSKYYLLHNNKVIVFTDNNAYILN